MPNPRAVATLRRATGVRSRRDQALRGTTPWGRGHPMSRLCTATSKQTAEQCGQVIKAADWAARKRVCDWHGGKSLSGPAHPNYKHGRHWQVLPIGLRDRFERALGDPELLSMTPEIAAMDA